MISLFVTLVYLIVGLAIAENKKKVKTNTQYVAVVFGWPFIVLYRAIRNNRKVR